MRCRHRVGISRPLPSSFMAMLALLVSTAAQAAEPGSQVVGTFKH
ncbi:hypothetical protein SAMN04488144_113126 [Methylobacterium sp. 190mf]|nr:hypothetical protein SAMN04488144_113126 [Methylobacterium sp. 190mf]